MRRWTLGLLLTTCILAACAFIAGVIYSPMFPDAMELYWSGLGIGIVIGALGAITLQRMAVERWSSRRKTPPAE